MVDYYIDNYSFKGFGIIVQESTGVVDLPKFKPPTEHDWAEYNGTIVDTEKTPRTEARQIQLKCALSAANQTDFLTKVNAFQTVFMTKGLKRLAIVLTHEVGLFFDVYMSDGLQVTKRWSDSTMVGQFTVNLCEPEPIKKIIRFDSQGSASTLSFQSSEAVSIYWGDGTVQQDLYGNVSLSHTYDEAGIYFAIIHGNIDNITDLTTSGDVLTTNNGGNIEIEIPEILNGALESVELFNVAEPGISQLTPYIRFAFNNNAETQFLRITIDASEEWQQEIVELETQINGKANEQTAFTIAQTRTNINSGDTVTTIWGKIKKWFTDLKAVAFSGSYNDISNKPLSVENNKVKYTLSDGTTKLTLVQEDELKAVAFSGSYNDLIDKLQYATTSAAGLMSADDKKKVNRINNFTINEPLSAISSNTAFGILCFNNDIANFKISISGSYNNGTFGQVNFGVAGRRAYGYFIEKNGICVSKSTYTINIGQYNSKLYLYAKFTINYKSAMTVLIDGMLSDSDFTNLNFEILNESNFSNIKSIQITSL